MKSIILNPPNGIREQKFWCIPYLKELLEDTRLCLDDFTLNLHVCADDLKDAGCYDQTDSVVADISNVGDEFRSALQAYRILQALVERLNKSEIPHAIADKAFIDRELLRRAVIEFYEDADAHSVDKIIEYLDVQRFVAAHPEASSDNRGFGLIEVYNREYVVAPIEDIPDDLCVTEVAE